MKSIYNLEILRATLADVGAVMNVEKECGLAKWTAGGYREEIVRESSLILKAICDTEIAGFIASRFAAERELTDNTKIYSEIDVLNFGVLKKYRRRGVGGALLDELIERASKIQIESVWLEVRESNTEAINLYQRKGFSAIQTRKNFYARPLENALILKLDI